MTSFATALTSCCVYCNSSHCLRESDHEKHRRVPSRSDQRLYEQVKYQDFCDGTPPLARHHGKPGALPPRDWFFKPQKVPRSVPDRMHPNDHSMTVPHQSCPTSEQFVRIALDPTELRSLDFQLSCVTSIEVETTQSLALSSSIPSFRCFVSPRAVRP